MSRVASLIYDSDARVFISYRRSDSTAYAGRLRTDLRKRFSPEQIFMDFDNIGAGEDFGQVIETAVRSCTVMVAMIGKLWMSNEPNGVNRLEDPDDYVRREIAAALERGIPVIPVLVQNATLPATQSLPPAIAALTGRHALAISDERWDYDVERLITSIERHSPKALRKSRVVISAIVLVGLLVVGLALTNKYQSSAAQKEGAASASPTPVMSPAPQSTPDLRLTAGSDIASSYNLDSARQEKVRFNIPIVAENRSTQEIVIMDVESELKALLPATNQLHLLGFEPTLFTQDGKLLKTPITLQKGSNVLSYSVMFELNEALRSQSTPDHMQELTFKAITPNKQFYSIRICFTVDGYSKEIKEESHSLEECPDE